MERKPDFPASNINCPIRGHELNQNFNNTATTASSSHSVSTDDFVSQINAVFKRHKPLGTLHNFPRASRVLVPQTDPSKSSSLTTSDADRKLPQALANRSVDRPLNVRVDQSKDSAVEVKRNLNENSSINPPSIISTAMSGRYDNSTLLVDEKKASSFNDNLREQISSAQNSELTFQSVDARTTIDTRMDDISSYMHSLTLTEGEDQFNIRVSSNDQDLKQLDLPHIEINNNARVDHMIIERKDEFRHNSMTQSSVVGSSCATTMSVHSGPTCQSARALYSVDNSLGILVKESDLPHRNQQPLCLAEVKKENDVSCSNVNNLQSQVPAINNSSSDVNSKVEKAPRKKKYDPDVFFKVNGKLYQKLGKIGSGGSSEVHKVITSDCTICALKKIKLKGRDYPTAYGFCQEIEYLNKLKGKSNIIQLIDYEVTDKTLLQEVMNGSMSMKDGKIKDDQFVYMVLEYGEIDLAHMLSHKWKEADNSSLKIDDNWLRFYWQQMLEAVNTIHEERIVHSDLKPANFLLVRGSLKLIDFGIAKAILSDTTNIQRDAQVGTLNYMSPEAFMWNEEDINGNTIKCGRPSDIWSLGCILYQMVYGKTPFAEYKTFWAKFKVITDKNHEINYEHVSNPLLIDLMKKCLAWDRNERWRIPQLLQHPFLVPPIPRELPPSLQKTFHDTNQCNYLLERINMYKNDPEVSRLCSELLKVVADLERVNKN